MKSAIRNSTISFCRKKKWYLLAGDSHLLAWSPLLYKLAILKEVSLLYVWVTIYQFNINTFKNTILYLNKLNTYKVDSVFISIFITRLLNNNSKLQHSIIEWLKLFKDMSNNTYFIEDVPFLKFDPHYYVREKVNNCIYNVNSNECLYYEYNIVKNFLNNKYLSFIDIICPKYKCHLLDGNILMYVDTHHLSLEFVENNKDKMLEKIKDTFKIANIGKVRLKLKEFHLYYINNSVRCYG